MKIKYNGNPQGCIDFITYGIIKDGEVLKRGKVYEIPEDKVPEYLLKAIEVSGDFEVLSSNANKLTLPDVKNEENKKLKEDR